MKRTILAVALLSALLATLAIGAGPGSAKGVKAPRGFFGIAPQADLTATDAAYMKAGGIESVRWPVSWAAVQPTASGGYDWSGLDRAVGVAARAGLSVLPAITGSPSWLAPRETKLPVGNGRQRSAWKRFLRAAVQRYGPGGDFWAERRPGVASGDDVIAKPMPIRTWQIWNEPNFFYFAFPVSPARYAKLVTISSQAIKSVHRGAKVMLAGFFGQPTARGKRGMPAATFLKRLYRHPGIKRRFDAVSLHPYATDSRMLRRLVEQFHGVLVKQRDRPDLYVTEIGWGSENNFQKVAFEQGPRGQVRQMRGSYRYLLREQRRLKLRGVYWFSWKDLKGSCDFCDSVGLFREGERFRPKPAWRAFVRIAGGRVRP